VIVLTFDTHAPHSYARGELAVEPRGDTCDDDVSDLIVALGDAVAERADAYTTCVCAS
jgi:hypothetical protein